MHQKLLNTPIEQIKKVGKALDNPERKKILNFCSAKAHNMTEIQKHLKIRFTTITNYVRILERAGMVKTRVLTTEKGRNVMVKSLVTVTKDGILKKVE